MNSAKKRVAIDARMVGEEIHGIGKYVSDLILALEKMDQASKLPYDIVVYRQKNIRVPKSFHHFENHAVPSAFLSPRELYEMPICLKRDKIDLYHSPSFSSLPYTPCPYVQTVHDLNHLQFGSVSKKIYYKTLLKSFAIRAKLLMTVSEFSKKEISEWLGASSPEIKVVRNSIYPFSREIAEHETEQVLSEYGLAKGQFLLCLSNRKSHKNLDFLIETYRALRTVARVQEPWPLVLTIPGPIACQGVRGIGNVNDLTAEILLRTCGGFVFPSLYEGFGRPPVEAAIHQKPLVISAIPPHVEALGFMSDSEAIFLEPGDFYAWVDALRMLMNEKLSGPNESSRERLIQTYQLRNQGEAINEVYSSIVAN